MVKPVNNKWLKTHHREVCIFFIIFISLAYFSHGASPNPISRLNTVLAFVESGPDQFSYRINRFISETELIFLVESEASSEEVRQQIREFLPGPVKYGHDALPNTPDWSWNTAQLAPDLVRVDFYSSKPPGPMLMSLPVYLLLYHTESALGLRPQGEDLTRLNSYLINLFVTVLPAALSAVFFYWIIASLALQQHRNVAMVLALALYLGTSIFPLSAQIWGHVTAVALTIGALYFFLQDSVKAARYCGFLMGLAVLTEYVCVVTLLTLFVCLLTQKKFNTLKNVVLGGLLPLVVFGIYHKICFGSFLTIAHFNVNPSFLSDERVGGIIGAINFDAVWGISFSPYRGMFYFMPVLLLGLFALGRQSRVQLGALFWVCIANILLYFLVNISFNGWYGGGVAAPRYQIMALPFYFLLISTVPLTRFRSLVFALTLSISLANAFVITSVSPIVPDRDRTPLVSIYTYFFRADFNQWYYPIRSSSDLAPDLQTSRGASATESAHRNGFNLGQLFGLQGLWSLAPLLVLYMAVLLAAVRKRRGYLGSE